MHEILWASLALSALAVSAALVALLLSVRENVKKNGRSLDILNQELPGLLGAMRLACQDLEAMLSWGAKLRGSLGRAAAFFRGLQALAGVFDSGKQEKAGHSNSGDLP